MALETILATAALFLAATVTVEIVVEGERPEGRVVSAKGEAGAAQGTTDASGKVQLAVPPGTRMVVYIDEREAGEIGTPPPGSHGSVSIRWPPTFSLRIDGRLPSVAARSGGPAGGGLERFRIVPIDRSAAGRAAEPREVALGSDAVIRVDWLLPGKSFDLYAPSPSGAAGEWIWYAGPFLVEANAEETLRIRSVARIALPSFELESGADRIGESSGAETRRILDVLAPQLEAYLRQNPEARIEVQGHTDRASAVRAYLAAHSVDPSRIAVVGESDLRVEIYLAPPEAPPASAQ